MAAAETPHRWAVGLATGLGAGYLPKMPGTYGSVEGVLVFLGLHALLPNQTAAFAILLLAFLSIWITALALPHFRSSDPQAIVIDEIAGQSVALAGLLFWPIGTNWNWYHVLAGFVLFRAFDITKPLFVRKLDEIHNAWGVVGDDLGAGVMAAAALLAWGYLVR